MKKYSNKQMQQNQATTKSTSNTAMGVVNAMEAY